MPPPDVSGEKSETADQEEEPRWFPRLAPSTYIGGNQVGRQGCLGGLVMAQIPVGPVEAWEGGLPCQPTGYTLAGIGGGGPEGCPYGLTLVCGHVFM